MAYEDFKKDQELLRLLFFAGGAYSRRRFAEAMGIGVDSFDKALRKLKENVEGADESWLHMLRGRESYTGLKFDYYHTVTNILTRLYNSKTLKKKELFRMAILLKALAAAPQKVFELAARLEKVEGTTIDEAVIKKYLRYLVEVGAVVVTGRGKNTRYATERSFMELTTTELLALFDLVSFFANTEILSVPGFVLSNTLRLWLQRQGIPNTDVYRFKYNYFGRVLDEFVCLELLELIAQCEAAQITYFPRQHGRRYEAMPTQGSRGQRTSPKVISIVPLKIVFDHQYGRWYLLARQEGFDKTATFRIENIVAVKKLDVGVTTDISKYRQEVEEITERSWVLGSGKRELVKIKFYYDADRAAVNFILNRVKQQGQWGQIIKEEDNCFLYEIAVNDALEMKPWIRSFGSSAEVLEPLWLRVELAQEWVALSKLYEPF